MEHVNRWLTLFANIGIVAGLVLVAFQLNQAERYADAEQVNAEFSMNLAGLDAGFAEALPEAWARARVNAQDLTEIEAGLVELYLQRRFQEQFLEYVQATRGHSSYDPDFAGRLFANQMLGNDVALRWWQNTRQGAGGMMGEFVKGVNAQLKRVGPEHRTLHQRRVKRLLEGPLPAEMLSNNE